MLTLVLAVTLQAPLQPPSCVLDTQEHTPFYLCDTLYGLASTLREPVPQRWFDAHCLRSGVVAYCDAAYDGPPPALDQVARLPRPGIRAHLKAIGSAIGFGVVAILVAYVYLTGGGGS